MKYVTLMNYRILMQEIWRNENLEGEDKPMLNARPEKKKRYYANLDKLHEKKRASLKEAKSILSGLKLSEGEKEMACNYYIKCQKTWKDAFELSSLLEKLSDEDLDDDECIVQETEKHKKRIERCLKEFY